MPALPYPLIVVSEPPQAPTGLGRIARDLVRRLIRDGQNLYHLVGPQGHLGPSWAEWRTWSFDYGDDWGARAVEHVWHEQIGGGPAIVLTIWDPVRCHPISKLDLPLIRWGYIPLDAANVGGGLSGIGRDALSRYDRLLAYGRWGSEVLRATFPDKPVQALPHGLDVDWLTPPTAIDPATLGLLGPWASGRILVGGVATNQPRKDLGLFCATLRTLLNRGWNIHGWLHTDRLIGDQPWKWSIPQLAEDFGLMKRLAVTTPEQIDGDQQLRQLYRMCSATIAPGRGEGFGYPIVESLAMGTPVIHGNHAGGAELVPTGMWRPPARAWQLEGLYAFERPIYAAEDFANAAERALKWRQADPQVVDAYCRGAVAHLDWDKLWGYWQGWLAEGAMTHGG